MITAIVTLLAGSSVEARLSDARDGQSYGIVELGGMRWMAENLRYAAPQSSCYDDRPGHCRKLGRLYLYKDALAACPAGWRLPGDVEWMKLEAAVGVPPAELGHERARGQGAGDRLKVRGGSGFDAVFAGYLSPDAGESFRRLGEAAAFWTATEDGRDDVSPLAWHRDVNVRRSGIYRSRVNVTYKLSVPCVQS